MSICINAQSFSDDLEKVRKIKLLESTRQDVKEILLNEDSKYFKGDYDDQILDFFYTNFSIIRVGYSTGTCSNEDEDWNIGKGRVTEISISPKDISDLTDSGINYSGFEREKRWAKNNRGKYIYHSKEKGIAIVVRGEIIDAVIFMPPKKDFTNLCNKPEVRTYYFGKRIQRNPIMKKNYVEYNFHSEVTDIKLSRDEIFFDCQSFALKERKNCLENKIISVSVSASDPENDPLVYNYEVSAEKIIGPGREVVWDLSEAKPGTYKITVFTDDGCGMYCGKWMTKSVVVK